MARVDTSAPRSSLVRVTPEASALLLLGASAWVAVVWLAASMGSMPGTMGLGLGAFLGVWALMMAAMMLPAVAPVAAAYARSFNQQRRQRLLVFASGYLVAWAAAGLVAYAAALVVDRLTGVSTTAARVVTAATLLGVAVYQLTPLKRMCLDHCRSPLSQLLRYAAFRGPSRDLRVGLHHAAFCLGCCWALMVLLVVLGTMNVFVMLGLAAFVVLEKYSSHGLLVSRLGAAAALALAAVALFVPQAGLGGSSMM